VEHAAARGRPAGDTPRLVTQRAAADVGHRREAGGAAGVAPGGALGAAEEVRGAHPDAEPRLRSGAPRRLPERLSVRDQVLSALRDALITGELEPGAVYSAPALAERFGVSATPVREAMQLLASEGAVEVMPNRGFRVAERSSRDLAELAEIRALLEVPVLLRLARTLPAERWESLRPLVDAGLAAAAVGDHAAYAEADRAFHRGLLALSGNRRLADLTDDLHRRAQWPRTTPARSRTSAAAARLLADAEEHVQLIEALTAGDVAAADALWRGHFQRAG
jgi:DNA-binding GntR family transcriptional regulator